MEFYRKFFNWLFFTMLTLHCIFIYLEMSGLRTLTKLFLLPMLITYLALIQIKENQPASILAFAGLLFAFFGDYLLSLIGEQFFLAGMLAFMITHICNSTYFIRLRKDSNNQKAKKYVWGMGILLSILIIFVYQLLQSELGPFKLPIQIYMCIIGLMALFAASTMLDKNFSLIAIKYFIPGAGLFVLSDAILALNKFHLHQSFWDIPIMVTYAFAQYFLVMGFRSAQQIKKDRKLINFVI